MTDFKAGKCGVEAASPIPISADSQYDPEFKNTVAVLHPWCDQPAGHSGEHVSSIHNFSWE